MTLIIIDSDALVRQDSSFQTLNVFQIYNDEALIHYWFKNKDSIKFLQTLAAIPGCNVCLVSSEYNKIGLNTLLKLTQTQIKTYTNVSVREFDPPKPFTFEEVISSMKLTGHDLIYINDSDKFIYPYDKLYHININIHKNYRDALDLTYKILCNLTIGKRKIDADIFCEKQSNENLNLLNMNYHSSNYSSDELSSSTIIDTSSSDSDVKENALSNSQVDKEKICIEDTVTSNSLELDKSTIKNTNQLEFPESACKSLPDIYTTTHHTSIESVLQNHINCHEIQTNSHTSISSSSKIPKLLNVSIKISGTKMLELCNSKNNQSRGL